MYWHNRTSVRDFGYPRCSKGKILADGLEDLISTPYAFLEDGDAQNFSLSGRYEQRAQDVVKRAVQIAFDYFRDPA